MLIEDVLYLQKTFKSTTVAPLNSWDESTPSALVWRFGPLRSIARRILVTVFAVALMALGPQALAYYSCSYTVTVHSTGGQSCSRTCNFYDNETHMWQGSITMEFQC